MARSSGLPRAGTALPSLGGAGSARIRHGPGAGVARVLACRATEWCTSGPPRASPPQSLRAGIARIQARAGGHRGVPGRGGAGGRARRPRPRGCPTLDRTDLPFVTIDPAGVDGPRPGAAPRARRDGYVVHYAIADVAAFVEPDGPVDLEAHRRGETLYGADSKVPLHPHGRSPRTPARCCPTRCARRCCGRSGSTRPARAPTSTSSAPGCARRARLDYAAAQRAIDDGTAAETLALLAEVGQLRLQREAARGGVSLPLPEQEVDVARRRTGRWSSAPSCRSRSGTPRSRCSPASAPPR